MTVLVANDTPPAIRGMLKRWFVEPKPNVFVGTVNRRTRDKVLDYVKHNAQGMSLLILSSEPNCQGFKIERWGEPDRRDVYLSGLWLVADGPRLTGHVKLHRAFSPHAWGWSECGNWKPTSWTVG
jgi:CRISPR-associated protein Cas2